MKPNRKVKTAESGRKPKKGDFGVGHTFSVGNKSNKNLPVADSEARLSRTVDNILVNRYLVENSHSTTAELHAKLENPLTSHLEKMIIRGMVRAEETGDVALLSFFLDRMIGKVPTTINLNKKNSYLEGLTDAQLIEEKKKIEDGNRKTLQIIEAEYRTIEPKQEETPNVETNRERTPES